MNGREEAKQKSVYASPEFESLLEEIAEGLKLEHTKKVYVSEACDLMDFAKKDFLKLSHGEVKAYFDSLCGLGRKTLVKKLSILRSIARKCDEMYNLSLITSFTGVTEPTPDEYIRLNELPALPDVGKVLSYLYNEGEYELYAILSLAIETGLSTEEICSLEYKDFFYDPSGQRFIKLAADSLSAPERFIPLKEETAELIEKIGGTRKSARGSDRIFRNRRGGAMTERVLQMKLHDACGKTGVKPFGIAKCRSLAIASILAAGGPVESLSYQLNLTNRWFYRYNHVVKELKTSAIAYNPLSADALKEENV